MDVELKPLRVLAYCRVSGKDTPTGEERRERLDGQEFEIRQLCRAKGWPAPIVFAGVESAAGGSGRKKVGPKQAELLASVRAGDLVVVVKSDRWQRDTIFGLTSADTLQDKQVGWYSILEPTLHKESRLNRTIKAALDEEDRERNSARLIKGRRDKRLDGDCTEGRVPLGYRRAGRDHLGRLLDRRLHVIPEQAAIVRKIYDLAILGWSAARIAEAMEVEYPEALKRWAPDKINQVLRNRKYTGQVSTAPIEKGGKWIPSHEPIIAMNTWLKVQKGLDARRIRGGGPSATDKGQRTYNWLLRGLATCPLCGARIGAAYGGNKGAYKNYYACNSRLARLRMCDLPYMLVESIDAKLTEDLYAHLKSIRSILVNEAPSKGPAPKNYDAMKKRLDTKRSMLIEVYTDGDLAKEVYKRRLEDLDRDIANLKAQEAQAKAQKVSADPQVKRDVLTKLDTLAKVYTKMTVPERRELLGMLASDIKVDPSLGALVTWKSPDDLLAVRGSYLNAS